ncbi:MAG TPA: DUF1778 domain-containing protein [Bryobacteraceae bacterium]|nr:DUF1778 domain-containing protein [Bryobacteraceae bacterium]
MHSQEQGRTARLEARIAPEALAVVRRAAEIRGRSVSDFVVAAAQEAATRTITETGIIRLAVEGQREMAALLLHPPAPGRALKKAFRRRRELLGGK